MNQVFTDWSPSETTRHQDHVIAHVKGTTVLGWFIAGEAAHLLLDIGFLWTIYLDGEMNLLPQGVAIPDLDEVSIADKSELTFDAQLLLTEGRDAAGLKRFSGAPVECLITMVELLSSDSQRRIVIRGETANVEIDTSLESAQLAIRSHSEL